MSDEIAKVLERNGHAVEIRNAAGVDVANMADGFDAVLLGSSTWGDEDIELQDDFVPVFESLDQAGLSGRKVGVFGCGDSSYTHFCGAVDAIEEKAEALGAVLMGDSLRIDGEPDNGEVEAWAQSMSEKF